MTWWNKRNVIHVYKCKYELFEHQHSVVLNRHNIIMVHVCLCGMIVSNFNKYSYYSWSHHESECIQYNNKQNTVLWSWSGYITDDPVFNIIEMSEISRKCPKWCCCQVEPFPFWSILFCFGLLFLFWSTLFLTKYPVSNEVPQISHEVP